MQLVKHQALRHARPLHAHDQVIDARGPVQHQHLLGDLVRRAEEKAIVDQCVKLVRGFSWKRGITQYPGLGPDLIASRP
jgi:hypothetical protein